MIVTSFEWQLVGLEVVETSATNEIATAPSLGEGTGTRPNPSNLGKQLGTTFLSTDCTCKNIGI